MTLYIDKNGFGWWIDLAASTVERVRQRLAVDLGELVHLYRLAGPEGWTYFEAILRAILEPQADERGLPPGAITLDLFDRPTLRAIRQAILQFGMELWETRLEASIDRISSSQTEGTGQCPTQAECGPARRSWSSMPISRN